METLIRVHGPGHRVACRQRERGTAARLSMDVDRTVSPMRTSKKATPIISSGSTHRAS